MLIRFYVSHGEDRMVKERVWNVASALTEGAKIFGDEVETVHNAEFSSPNKDVDVACCWGVVGNAKEIMKGYTQVGKRTLMFDKALIRRLGNERYGHYRVGMDGPSSLKYMMREYRKFDRWEGHRIRIKPKQELNLTKGPGAILYAGSSQKYCDYYNLGEANDYAEGVFNTIRGFSGARRFRYIYRPKPSWGGSREIEGTKFSGSEQHLIDVLATAFILITHGSAAAVEAIVTGVPVITLGPCSAQPVANTSLDSVMKPYFPSDEARYHWLCNLAYCQWTAEEFKTGEAWEFFRKELFATEKNNGL